MIEVRFRYETDGEVISPEELADQYELEMLFEHTRSLTEQHIQNKLSKVVCPVHGNPPRVMVTAAYSTDTQQIELAYHVDSCCQQLLLDTIRSLNH